MNQTLAKAIQHWHYVAPLVKYPENDKDFDKLIRLLDELLQIVGEDEKHPLMGLVDILSDHIAEYESEHFSIKSSVNTNKSIETLKFLMSSHNLKQSDLSEIASQGVLSEILSGKRQLNLRQIKLLAKRFGVSPATFINE